ncbi:MAG: GNAT family N-acetyltransferase [Promethearchaeota archaeon]
MNNLTLREVKSDDSELTYQIKRAAFKEYIEKVWGWDEKEQRKLHERRFASQDYQVIQVDNIDVGYMSIVQQPDCIKLYQMFVLPEYQNKGIGTKCMLHIINEATLSKLPIRLQVLKVNSRAFKFYQGLGFKSTEESENHILMEK